MMKMAEINYEVLDVLTDKEIVKEYLYMHGSGKFKLTDRDMELLYTLAKYGVIYAEDAMDILKERKPGRRKTRLKSLGILDSKRGLVYLGQFGREALLELNLNPRSVQDEDKILCQSYNQLASEYRNDRISERETE